MNANNSLFFPWKTSQDVACEEGKQVTGETKTYALFNFGDGQDRPQPLNGGVDVKTFVSAVSITLLTPVEPVQEGCEPLSLSID